MPLLSLLRLISLGLILSLAAGCAHYKSAQQGRGAGRYPDTPTARPEIDELLGFGADMAEKPASARAEECKSLLKRQREAPSPGVQLYLMIGRLLSESCGDISKVLDGVESIPAKALSDERVRWLVAIDTEALRRMANLSRRIGSLERKHKTVQTVLESKESKETKESKDTKGGKKDEARMLREKLEAIRAMEKKLDESGEGN